MIDNFTNSIKYTSRRGLLTGVAASLPPSAEPGLDAALISPVREYLSRDSKQVRAQLVRIGFCLAGSSVESVAKSHEILLDCLSCMVEALHAGSLMIDDIQDADEMRRGKAALHIQIGVPRTINAANWLYFWPMELLRQQALPPSMELEIYRLFHKTMMHAHQGQALDLGYDMTQISKREAADISLAAIELKTGELTGMCTELGAIVRGADSEKRNVLAKFGRRFGVALQAFNDIGEVSSKNKNSQVRPSLVKPSWVWAVAARELEPADFARFQQLMGHTRDLSDDCISLSGRVMAKATELALSEFENCMNDITSLVETDAQRLAQSDLQKLAQKVMCAYA